MAEKESKGKIYILFGIEETKFITQVRGMLEKLGYEVISQQRYSKTSVRDFLEKNPEYNNAVLKEVMGKSRYSAEELAELCDLRDINIIAVLGESHKGTPYMQLLYNAGITSALFHSASRADATPENVVRLILEKRTREKARQVYGLSDAQMAFDVLTPAQIDDGIAAIQDESYGATLGIRYLAVMSGFKTKQAFQFIQSMPISLRNELEKTDEFYMVLLKLQDRKVTINKKSWQEGMQRVLRQRKLEGKKKPVLEISEDAKYTIRQEVEKVKQARIREEYGETGTYTVPEGLMEQGDEFDRQDNLNVSGSYYADNPQPPRQDNQASLYGQNHAGMEGQGMGLNMMPNVPYQYGYPYPQQMPPMGDWKSYKRMQKEQEKLNKKQMRDMKRNARIGNTVKPEKEPRAARKREKEVNPMDIGKEKLDMKPFIKRMLISVGVLLFIAAVVVAVMASNNLSQQNMQKKDEENNILVEQMNDLSELRGNTHVDISKTVPKIDGLSNGDSVMGIQVMDTINASGEMFYVISLSGEIFTFQSGGATSNEVDVNSMYEVRLLSSGRFAFVQL